MIYGLVWNNPDHSIFFGFFHFQIWNPWKNFTITQDFIISKYGNGGAIFTNTLDGFDVITSVNQEEGPMAEAAENYDDCAQDRKTRILMDLLSHDINNHIYGSMGYLELLQSMVQDNPTLIRYLSNSMSELKSISHLVDNVRLLVNLSDEEFRGESVDVYKTLKKASEAAEYQIDNKELELKIDFEENECRVMADRFLQDVFVQLLMNSMKYCKEEKALVKISSENEDGTFFLTYEDNGKGISDNLKDKVFTRFDKSIREGNVHGKGMVLSVVKSVLGRYGGDISLEDVKRDEEVKGTRFRLKLPAWKD
jgi:signal transduction histidine kinase